MVFEEFFHVQYDIFTYHICISLPLNEQRHGNMASDGGQPMPTSAFTAISTIK